VPVTNVVDDTVIEVVVVAVDVDVWLVRVVVEVVQRTALVPSQTGDSPSLKHEYVLQFLQSMFEHSPRSLKAQLSRPDVDSERNTILNFRILLCTFFTINL